MPSIENTKAHCSNDPISVARFETCPAKAAPSLLKMLQKRRTHESAGLIPIGVDEANITSASGTAPLSSYKDLGARRYIALTKRECDIVSLACPGKHPPIALEQMCPWISEIAYRSESGRNYQELERIKSKYHDSISSPRALTDRYWGTACNKVRRKTSLDERFYTAWHSPVQDAYVLSENREDRIVIAIDFNSMYAACMQGIFPKPSKLRHVQLNRKFIRGERLEVGLYKCVLHNPSSDFIRIYNPFRVLKCESRLRASLSGSIKVDLNEFEVSFFAEHFERIELIDAVASRDSVPHPLAREARRSFSRRLHYRRGGNKSLADFEKFLLTLMCSSTHRPEMMTVELESLDHCKSFLADRFGVSEENNYLSEDFVRWLASKKISIKSVGPKIHVAFPNLQSAHACFQFNQRIVAKSRIQLLEFMNFLSNLPQEVEICYANIDSIHMSLPKRNSKEILGILHDLSSDALGSFKIESVASNGLWLEPGRYWLYDGCVRKFRNRSINKRLGSFSEVSHSVSNAHIGKYSIPIRNTVTIQRSMSKIYCIKPTEDLDFCRQAPITVSDVSSKNDIFGEMARNLRVAIPYKIELFRNLKSKFAPEGPLPRNLGGRSH